MKRNGAAHSSSGSRRDAGRSRRHRGLRDPNRRRFAKGVDERTDAERLADMGWVEWGGELIWAVGFTSGGAPFGLRPCDFDPSDLQAMGLDIPGVDDAGPASAESWVEESDAWPRDTAVE